jgi:hypothetical protein
MVGELTFEPGVGAEDLASSAGRRGSTVEGVEERADTCEEVFEMGGVTA